MNLSLSPRDSAAARMSCLSCSNLRLLTAHSALSSVVLEGREEAGGEWRLLESVGLLGSHSDPGTSWSSHLPALPASWLPAGSAHSGNSQTFSTNIFSKWAISSDLNFSILILIL